MCNSQRRTANLPSRRLTPGPLGHSCFQTGLIKGFLEAMEGVVSDGIWHGGGGGGGGGGHTQTVIDVPVINVY
jgi:hypothetical protein